MVQADVCTLTVSNQRCHYSRPADCRSPQKNKSKHPQYLIDSVRNPCRDVRGSYFSILMKAGQGRHRRRPPSRRQIRELTTFVHSYSPVYFNLPAAFSDSAVIHAAAEIQCRERRNQSDWPKRHMQASDRAFFARSFTVR